MLHQSTQSHSTEGGTGLQHSSSTTAVFSYAIGSRTLSAFVVVVVVAAQTVVSLLQTTQIIMYQTFVL